MEGETRATNTKCAPTVARDLATSSSKEGAAGRDTRRVPMHRALSVGSQRTRASLPLLTALPVNPCGYVTEF